ncbi:MAG: hypothetical protein K8L91_09355 [Anaerolineae bacterium]|nr:hypothetical protein [Anaerolineae bacterium]
MNPIFIVVGPPAVGKSTTSRALAAHFPRSLHIPVDDFRNMVVSGIELPGAVWGEGLIQQVHLARTCATHMALAYHQAGFAVVIDDFWDAYHDLDYQALHVNPPLHRIVLYPQQEEAHRRNFQRSGDSPARAFINAGIQQVYERLNPVIPRLAQDGWLIVDTTELSVEATVNHILEQLGSR